MPAPEVSSLQYDNNVKTLGHVNLMVDTFIANATLEDLRAITRTLLATGSPSLASAFTAAARARLRQTGARRLASSNSLFAPGADGFDPVPTSELHSVLARARSLYGAGMGFASLGVLYSVVSATVGLRWETDGDMADALAVVDADITQAIQSCKEELEGNRVSDMGAAREVVGQMRSAVEESTRDVQGWGGEFPFDRAACSIEYWKF
ncbi:hypothetical protein CONPUDRAFT_112910 [Coniophora puteana RWD-64-598 SS2]|uniref:Uncharacterized protein n=1 Tax=Coniophora puteana (strain RWD-64-598) TaxID=741705 RepID=A0A5M3M859_CONPW|nr:uncharacterized protein CONPUDRAFT_112910 [Coniophora puteana RWD-64-598 SS2]EIW74975.1 hypothetical protein CONPUDRAFT_112910 [Coniophora puteana RWD-64-598 SS2]